MIYSVSGRLLGNAGQTESRGSRGGLLTAGKQCQSHSQTTGERLRSQARLIDILTYCTFPEREDSPVETHYCLTAAPPPSNPPLPGFDPLNVKQIAGEAARQLTRPANVKVSADACERVGGRDALSPERPKGTRLIFLSLFY